ncbi:YqkE family protein [Paenibacillus xerothermodurans]|uniref:DUF3886 domain-containing protein n=1 Tax=Paenibacillus xerothermodurans TaxID=1977292 RepID=A0A2W1P3D9_PAEXE|nr:YqkE family protein [Paenibacillus xerothermodurans]PZE22222.1 DUF3886 domain-containing protein [Paenibacillus xerothermodurans]
MAHKKSRAHAAKPAAQEKAATLKDLLNPDVLNKLKEQSEQLKTEEQGRREAQRAHAEAARKAEQKRLDNDFEYLLNNSNVDWRKYK